MLAVDDTGAYVTAPIETSDRPGGIDVALHTWYMLPYVAVRSSRVVARCIALKVGLCFCPGKEEMCYINRLYSSTPFMSCFPACYCTFVCCSDSVQCITIIVFLLPCSCISPSFTLSFSFFLLFFFGEGEGEGGLLHSLLCFVFPHRPMDDVILTFASQHKEQQK